MQEHQIISDLRAGDKHALGMIYDRYGAAVYGMVLRIVKSQSAAEEVVQDAFLKIYSSIERYDERKGRFSTWVLNIARNAAIDSTRTTDFRNRRQTDCFDAASYGEPNPMLTNVDAIGLRELVNRLGENHQQVIELAYFQGFTQKEIEAELGIPIGTVKTRIRLAILELRKAFGTYIAQAA